MKDIIIIGSGPAGLTAALYALRANRSVLIIEKAGFGGQMLQSPKIENYPAIGEISGAELADRMVEQVIAQGGEFEFAEVLGIEQLTSGKLIRTDSGEFEARSVIIATGVKHRTLKLKSEDTLTGHGISYCAVCDGAFARDSECVIVGGGNSALQEALMLSELVKHLTVVQNLPSFTGESRLSEKLMKLKNVDTVFNTVVTELISDTSGELSGIKVKNTVSGIERRIECTNMFIAIGLEPQNSVFSALLPLDAQGYFVCDDDCATAADGIFVAGDCRSKKVRQITTAAADGAIAALSAVKYLG